MHQKSGMTLALIERASGQVAIHEVVEALGRSLGADEFVAVTAETKREHGRRREEA